MGKHVSRQRVRAERWLTIALMVVAVGGAAGCATAKNGAADGASTRAVWQAGEQFVKIERQDHPAGGTVPVNVHPADIPVDRLRYVLDSIVVVLPGKDSAEQLFNDDELKLLSEKIHKGLAAAGPHEDVTFAVIGHHAVLLGFLKQRMITTGRVFCQDGRINIIFGDILREVKENEDRRLYPFLSGSRSAGVSRELALSVKPERENFTMKRPDWVIFPIAGPVVSVGAPASPQSPASAGPGNRGVTPAETREKPAPAAGKSVEERLIILNDLRHKKLITDEEYRAKRLEILNGL